MDYIIVRGVNYSPLQILSTSSWYLKSVETLTWHLQNLLKDVVRGTKKKKKEVNKVNPPLGAISKEARASFLPRTSVFKDHAALGAKRFMAPHSSWQWVLDRSIGSGSRVS